jgi:hypothetical protein
VFRRSILKRACVVLTSIALIIPCFGLSQTSEQERKPLTNQAVVSLVRSGIDDDTIIGLIKSHLTQFDTSPQALKDLKQNGLHSQIIEAMIAAVRPSSSSSQGPKSQDAGRATSSPLSDALNNPPSNSASNGTSSRSTRPHRSSLQSPSSESQSPSATPATSPTDRDSAPLSQALDVAPHSSPQEVLAGTSVLAVTLDVIDQAGVAADRTFRAETIAPVRHGLSEVLPVGALIYLKVVNAGANSDWIALNISVDSIVYKGSPIKVSSNVQRVRIRTNAESLVRNRTVRWPIQQVQIMPKTRFSFRIGAAVQ